MPTQSNHIEKVLKDINKYKAKIDDIELEIAELKDLQSLKHIDYDNLIKTKSLLSKSEIQEMKNLDINQTLEILEYKKRHIERFLKRLNNAMNSLDNLEKQIIQLKCIDNKIWKAITFEVNLEERQCSKIKGRALKKIEKLIDNIDIIKI